MKPGLMSGRRSPVAHPPLRAALSGGVVSAGSKRLFVRVPAMMTRPLSPDIYTP